MAESYENVMQCGDSYFDNQQREIESLLKRIDQQETKGIISVFRIIKTIRTLRLRIIIDRLATGEKRAPFTRRWTSRWTPYWGQGLPQSLL